MASATEMRRERWLGVAGVVMIIAVIVAGIAVLSGHRNESAVPGPDPTAAVPSSPATTPQPSATPTPTPTPTVVPDAPTSPAPPSHPPAAAKPRRLTEKNLPTSQDLVWEQAADWRDEATYDGAGDDAPSLCLPQDSTGFDGVQAIFRRNFTLPDQGYATALIFSFETASQAEAIFQLMSSDASGCRGTLKKGGFDAKEPTPFYDVEIPEGITGKFLQISYQQRKQPDTTNETIGLVLAANRILFLSMVVQADHAVWSFPGSTDHDRLMHPMAQSLANAAERLTF
ncbi:MAG: hypothetical protein QOF52_904 [Propionibacteriaceae bacterium]|jgi:hypothetical protein|nr:hypothetical protein [Propionibacteriaceae bacterium]MDX6321046.1 hypothetical protein [Propionibacteriaceae bacterium]